jgi:hypothetical protein
LKAKESGGVGKAIMSFLSFINDEKKEGEEGEEQEGEEPTTKPKKTQEKQSKSVRGMLAREQSTTSGDGDTAFFVPFWRTRKSAQPKVDDVYTGGDRRKSTFENDGGMQEQISSNPIVARETNTS